MDLTKLDFPYYNKSINKKNILEHFEEFKNYKSNERKEGKYFHIIINYDKEEKFLRLTDYFSEDVRIRCHFSDFISVYDWYQENKKKIIKELGEVVSYNNIDNYIWSRTKACSNFPTVIALALLKKLKPQNWLDPSAGWGDRLIASIAYGCNYHGIDPNPKMQKNYKKIVDVLGDKNHEKYHVLCKGFENSIIMEDYYDLVFTSPPFFDLEKYGDDKNQSIKKYPTLKSWITNFIYPFLVKSVKALKRKGHLALYVSDYSNIRYVQKIKNFMKSQITMKWEGEITWQVSKNKRHIIIWKKI
jgi:tRNA1(Val) A37 N6-methylase TrmN6